MPDIIAVVDETAATNMFRAAEEEIGIQQRSGSKSLGPFTVEWEARGTLVNGNVDLIPPNVIRIADGELDFTVAFTLSINLNNFLPAFCVPRVCVPIPFLGSICTPRICLPWWTIDVPFSYTDTVRYTADFSLNPHLVGSNWKIDLVILGIPSLGLDPVGRSILIALETAIREAASAVPLIGPFLEEGVALIISTIGVAATTGLLGPILTPFISGTTLTIYNQPRLFPVLPAAGALDPVVNVNLDGITAVVQRTDEDELVIRVDISPV